LTERLVVGCRGEKAFYSDECRNGFIEEAAEEEVMILDPARNL
jgi:hypothetical protein